MRNTGRCSAILALVAIAAGDAAQAASAASNAYYERTLMSAAGERCGLFTPAIGAALAAAARQARGAALRAGSDMAELKGVETRARAKAAATACRSNDLTVAAQRVRTGFEGYAKLYRMTFPGDVSSWQADRFQSATMVRWNLQQSASGVVFGVSSDNVRGLTAVTAAAKAQGASGARLVMRDPARAPSAYLDPRRNSLAGRQAPRSASIVFLASARGPAPQGLMPEGVQGAAFRFPVTAANAIDVLDPREAVALELVFPARGGGRERVETVLFEVGDFAAGRAFLAAQPN